MSENPPEVVRLTSENERLRRVIGANLADARNALLLLDKGLTRDYVDNIRFNSERALASDESGGDQ